MKIKITESTEKTVEIILPAYRKDRCHYYKVYTEENCIVVCDLDFNFGISKSHSGLAFRSKDIEDCSEEEFEENYNKVKHLLQSLV